MRQTKNLGWLNALINIGRVIQPSAQDAPKIKKDITYHVKMRAIIHYDDGTTEERNYTENITRPAVNSPFGS
jgi:hypothetical protein